MDTINASTTLPIHSNVLESASFPRSDEDSTRIQIDGNSSRLQVDGDFTEAHIDKDSPNIQAHNNCPRIMTGELSREIVTKNPKISGVTNSKKPAKEGKYTLKRKEPTKEKNSLKKQKSNSLSIPQMVMESIKALRKRNGASVEDILEYMEGQYHVDAKLIKRYVSRYLLSAVQKGTVERLTSAGGDGRFKIKKAEKIVGQKIIKTGKFSKIGKMIARSLKQRN